MINALRSAKTQHRRAFSYLSGACPAPSPAAEPFSTWPEWGTGIVQVTLDGPFAAGTTGTMTPEGQDPLPFTLTEAVPGEGGRCGEARGSGGHCLRVGG